MGGTRTENGGQDEREEYGTVDLHAERHGPVLGLGGGGFRGRDSGIGTGIGVTMPLGSRPPVSCNVLFEDGKVIGWEAVNGF